MAIFSFSQWNHALHQSVQTSSRKSLGLAVLFGGGGAVLITLLMAIPRMQATQTEIVAITKNIEQTKTTITKLQGEKLQQPAVLESLNLQPLQAKIAALTAAGYTQENILYWQKQMTAFGLMKGISLVIAARGISSYENSAKLTIQISPADMQPIAPMLLAQTLDFLQLYGFVESFDGSQAIVHVSAEKP